MRAVRTGVAEVMVLVVLSTGSVVLPRLAAAQSGLEQVEQLTRLGRTEDARTALMTWWSEERSDASRRELQRGLWLRGRLTVDPVQAELDFRRLAVLYPSGQFTADAILRLAQASWAMGDEQGARGHVATLTRDYPNSDASDQAEAWLADAGPLPPAGDTPTRVTAQASSPDGAVGEVVSDSGQITGRGATDRGAVEAGAVEAGETGAGAAGESAADAGAASQAEPDEGSDDESEAMAPVVNYYVQLGAFAEEDRAFALHEEVQAAGIDVRVVRVEGSRFTHVRVGRFAERTAAVDLLEELTAKGISAALVRDDRPEEQIRDR
jgi:cell division septation protein DedD